MKPLFLFFLFICSVALATQLSSPFQRLEDRSAPEGSPLLALLGDSRRLFANQFFTMADVYFHSGFYPTIFDARKQEGPNHLDVATHEEENGPKSGKEAPDEDESFMGPPRDWIEKFGRNFIPTVHTHLQGANAREMLPWLKLSAELDPKRVETYVTASYWLRSRLDQPEEAAEFLRQGLAANPDSPEILLELGRVFFYSKKNSQVARNLWEQGLAGWDKQDEAKENPDPRTREEILGELVRADEQGGDLKQLLGDLERLEKVAPGATLEKYIQDTKAKLAH